MLLDVKFHRQAINLKEDLNFRVVCVPDMRLFCKFVIHTCDCLNCVFNCFSLLWIFDCFAGKHRGRIFKCTNSACVHAHASRHQIWLVRQGMLNVADLRNQKNF